MDDSGRICGLTYSSSDTEVDLVSLNSICATSDITCNSTCRDDIRIAKELSGCCVNWVNASTDIPVALSYSVWKSCGIETPGFCESPLSLRGAAVKDLESHLALLTIAGLLCQYIYGSIMTE